MNPADILSSIQTSLKQGGFYDGQIDSKWGPLSGQALNDCVKASLAPVVVPATASAPVDVTGLGLQHNDWPLEDDAGDFFGYPPNLTQVELPYVVQIDAEKVTHVTCNMKVAASLRRIFAAIFTHFGGNMEAIHDVGLDIYDGCYDDRSIRGSSRRSMHAYGAAIDLDAEHNPLGALSGRMPRAVVDIFKAEGWRWGGDYAGRKDWMHFEACR